MRLTWSMIIAALAFASASEAADACRIRAQLNFNDVEYADVVLVGRVKNYRIVRDVEFRRKMLANPKIRPEWRKFYEGPTGLISDYARFDVQVDKVLAGKAPSRLSVTWDNSTFGEPEQMTNGSFLIALRNPYSDGPPLRGPSAFILPKSRARFLDGAASSMCQRFHI